jgi:hypothetical protein
VHILCDGGKLCICLALFHVFIVVKEGKVGAVPVEDSFSECEGRYFPAETKARFSK